MVQRVGAVSGSGAEGGTELNSRDDEQGVAFWAGVPQWGLGWIVELCATVRAMDGPVCPAVARLLERCFRAFAAFGSLLALLGRLT